MGLKKKFYAFKFCTVDTFFEHNQLCNSHKKEKVMASKE